MNCPNDDAGTCCGKCPGFNETRNETILITGIGAPGATGVTRSLYGYTIIGVDSDPDCYKGHVDRFYPVSKASVDFIDEVLAICENERVKVIIPLVTVELYFFASTRLQFEKIGVTVLVSNFDTIVRSNNKFTFLQVCGVPTPEHYLVNSAEDFDKAKRAIKGKACLKPTHSNGGRGFRVIGKDNLTEKENKYITDPGVFNDLIVMEFLEGDEYTVDVLCHGGPIKVIPRLRKKVKNGISSLAVVENNQQLIDYSIEICKKFPDFYGIIGFQFIDGRVIECNPRVQGGTWAGTAAGYNMIGNAVRIALGKQPIDYDIEWGTKMVRFSDVAKV